MRCECCGATAFSAFGEGGFGEKCYVVFGRVVRGEVGGY